MPRKSDLGRPLLKDRFKGRRGKKAKDNESVRHSQELGDGYDWNRINLRSVTDETSIDEFLNTAQLAGTEFTAEKLNISFVDPRGQIGIPSLEERRRTAELQRENAALLQIPRRPAWTARTSPAELHSAEEEAFLAWRRQLAQLQEAQELTLTPYERNLALWRQLWRVVERSDVVVQILDARNPLLYRCEDLERYVLEVSEDKDNVLLVNKSDLLTAEQRACWARYFNANAIKAAFFSALNEADPPAPETIDEQNEPGEEDSEEGDTEEEEGNGGEESDSQEEEDSVGEEGDSDDYQSADEEEDVSPPKLATWPDSDIEPEPELADWPEPTLQSAPEDRAEPEEPEPGQPADGSGGGGFTSARLLSRHELIALLKSVVDAGQRRAADHATVGFVGYPNVGKSSTINALLQAKRVSVSATPGKTKHFQTLSIDAELMLCDCPGLVMPSFLSTKAEMVVWGVLPIDQMRDHVPPVNTVAHLVPRAVLENSYSLQLPAPREGEPPDRPATAEELCNAYGFTRGFMTARGMPDRPRAARHILKDFVRGRLLYCVAPPGSEQAQFHSWPPGARRLRLAGQPPPQERMVKPTLPSAEEVDRSFFNQLESRSHSRDVRGELRTDGLTRQAVYGDDAASLSTVTGKPWRAKGATKRPQKGKLRRIYRHLDDV